MDTIDPNASENSINFYKKAKSEELLILKKLIGSSLEFYVDQSVSIVQDELIYASSQKKMIKDINSIVKDGIQYYNFKELTSFIGFSDLVESKIEQIFQLDLSQLTADNQNDKESLQYYTVQKELNDLKLILNVELGNFANDNLLAIVPNDTLKNSQKKELEDILNFKKYDPLDPIDINISDSSLAIIQQEDKSSLNATSNENSFQDLVLDLLRENNEQIKGLEKRLEDLELDRSSSLEQLDWERIKNLVEANYGGISPIDRQIAIPINNLPNSVTIYFEKASYNLSLGNKLILNEIIDILGHNARLGVIITGYADQSGSEYSNYNLSKKRANSVRKLVLQSGINSNRVMMNYFGDNKSTQINPGDRKVVIEFIPF